MSPEERDTAFRDLQSSDPGRVVEAAKLLAEDRVRATTLRLVAVLDSATRTEVRHGALHAVAWHGDPATWELMVRVLLDPAEDPRVRGQAAEGLAYGFSKVTPGSAPFESGVAALKVALKDPSPEVRYCAVHALGATRHRLLTPYVEQLLDDTASVTGWAGTVAEEAARALEFMRHG